MELVCRYEWKWPEKRPFTQLRTPARLINFVDDHSVVRYPEYAGNGAADDCRKAAVVAPEAVSICDMAEIGTGVRSGGER